MTVGAKAKDAGIHQLIDSLVDHYQAIGLLQDADRAYCRNLAFSLLQEDARPYEGYDIPTADALRILVRAARERNLLAGEGTAFEDDFLAKLTNIFLPRPSEYTRLIEEKYRESPQQATDAMYQIAIDTDYIKHDRVSNNIHHRYRAPFGDIEVTINVSKPEKSPEEIRLAQTHDTGYPKCLLCLENGGLSDVPNPARAHHRVFPITLDGEPYYFQYSPYAYFNEHCIIFSHKHEPMQIHGRVIDRFLDFVDCLPHYFISANADLPIVGGSILTHDHYQGGRARFPIDDAQETVLYHSEHLRVAKLSWPISAVRLQGERSAVASAAKRLMDSWTTYSNPALDIIAKTDQPHNTVNIMARKEKDYQLTLMFRNNRSDETHPDGIFHTSPIWQVVKRENIGIIETLGLAILPKRLVDEMNRFDELPAYRQWCLAVPSNLPPLDQLGYTFSRILVDCGVFKDDSTSQRAFDDFLRLAYENTASVGV